MRIRKNRLLSLAFSVKSGIVLQTHVCHLNQNPWDVMDFSLPCQVEANDVFPTNVSFQEHIAANDIVDAMEIAPENENKKRDYSGGSDAACEPEDGPVVEPEIVLCCKTDGKSWRCKQEAAHGNTLCHHHLLQSQRCTTLAHSVAKKAKKKEVAEDKPMAERETRRRPRAKKALSGSNPYEFYYYSGFGPTWGKRGGESSKNDRQETDQMASAELSPIDIQDFMYLDHEEDEEKKADNGRKRARKPVKARSLKSLM